LAYFNRAVVRYKQLDYTLAGEQAPTDMSNMSLHLFSGKNQAQSQKAKGLDKSKRRAYEHEMIVRDYDQVLRLNPDFVYAYFNRANLRCAQRDYRAAILDYSEAISRNKDFAEAYFNRGLTRLYLGDTNEGILDLSKAGELGMVSAYNIIKRMTVSNN
jgi:tetratricopeptide (TPR) repeat protein